VAGVNNLRKMAAAQGMSIPELFAEV